MCQFWVDNHPLTGENRTTIGPNCQKISCKYSEAGKIWRSMTGSPGAMQTARGNAAGGSLITIWHGTAGETPPTAYVNGRPVIDPNTNAEGSESNSRRESQYRKGKKETTDEKGRNRGNERKSRVERKER
ncbi:unnamed protein product [Fusarium graminearum]|uniref:Uncharacterized protein n=1 Tax=Gibberella zeae TaxID=5518 RepID=A0A9N8REV4_GIBZA|nr:unnamed protein product [Fusarium graminearum]CAG1987837.1 unnamed protein product [Fusarium graminearum]